MNEPLRNRRIQRDIYTLSTSFMYGLSYRRTDSRLGITHTRSFVFSLLPFGHTSQPVTHPAAPNKTTGEFLHMPTPVCVAFLFLVLCAIATLSQARVLLPDNNAPNTIHVATTGSVPPTDLPTIPENATCVSVSDIDYVEFMLSSVGGDLDRLCGKHTECRVTCFNDAFMDTSQNHGPDAASALTWRCETDDHREVRGGRVLCAFCNASNLLVDIHRCAFDLPDLLGWDQFAQDRDPRLDRDDIDDEWDWGIGALVGFILLLFVCIGLVWLVVATPCNRDEWYRRGPRRTAQRDNDSDSTENAGASAVHGRTPVLLL